MSNRLANRARAIRRKRARGVDVPEHPVVSYRAPTTDDPWSNIPEDQRKTITTVLPNGCIVTSYVDTLDDLRNPVAVRPMAPKVGALGGEAVSAAKKPSPVVTVQAPSLWAELEKADARESIDANE